MLLVDNLSKGGCCVVLDLGLESITFRPH